MQDTITIEAQVILTPDNIDLIETAEAFNEGRTVLLTKIEVEIELDDIDTDDLVNEVTSRIDITRTQAKNMVDEMFDLYSDM